MTVSLMLTSLMLNSGNMAHLQLELDGFKMCELETLKEGFVAVFLWNSFENQK